VSVQRVAQSLRNPNALLGRRFDSSPMLFCGYQE
jgi:hypothetical protein